MTLLDGPVVPPVWTMMQQSCARSVICSAWTPSAYCRKPFQSKSYIVNTTPEELITNPYEKLAPLLRAVFERQELLHGLIVGGWKPLVLKNIRAAFDGAIDWGQLHGVSPGKIETMHICIRGILMETCYNWSMSDNPMDQERLIKTACEFVSGGLKHIMEQA